MEGYSRRIGAGYRSDPARDRAFWPQETCWLWFLGADQRLIDGLVLPGSLSAVTIPLGSVTRALVQLEAAYLFMAHSHPSGEARPSGQDIVATRQIWRAARAVGVSLQDHYIFGRGACFSFRDHGLL